MIRIEIRYIFSYEPLNAAVARRSPTLTSAGFDMMGMIASASGQFISGGYCLTGQSLQPCAPVSVSDLKANRQRQVEPHMLAHQRHWFPPENWSPLENWRRRTRLPSPLKN